MPVPHIRLIGDTHADNRTKMARYLASAVEAEASIQLGDMNAGFPDFNLPYLPTHKFFRGNHDNPEACRAHPNYLGDFGYMETPSIYWISGAYTTDGRSNPQRVRGKTWWPDREELDWATMKQIADEIGELKPRIILSHDCPQAVALSAHCTAETTNTRLGLSSVFHFHQPELWFYGHYHMSAVTDLDGTRFRCLAELEAFDIEL